jgi:translation initiation factor IF-2
LRKFEIKTEVQDAEVTYKQRMQHRGDRVRAAARESVADMNIRAAATETTELGAKELKMVSKADMSRILEAIVGAPKGMGNKEAAVKIVTAGVGGIAESDVMMTVATQCELRPCCPVHLLIVFVIGMVVAFYIRRIA